MIVCIRLILWDFGAFFKNVLWFTSTEVSLETEWRDQSGVIFTHLELFGLWSHLAGLVENWARKMKQLKQTLKGVENNQWSRKLTMVGVGTTFKGPENNQKSRK